MKVLFLSLVISLSIAVPVLNAQEAKPAPAATPAPVPTGFEAPKKPEKDPVTAEEFYDAARWENWNGRDSNAAIKLLTRAIEIQPDFIDGYRLRGIMNSQEDRCKEAIADFDIVIQLEPDAINTYQNRGECKVRLKDYAGALLDFDMSVSSLAAKNLVQYNAFEKRGKLKYILGQYDGAIEDLSSAVKMDRGDGALFFRALTYIKKNDPIGALRDLNSLAEYYERVVKDSRLKYPDQYTEKKGYPVGENPLATLKKPSSKGAAGTRSEAVSGVGTGRGGGTGTCTNCREVIFAEFGDKLVPDNWFFPGKKTYLPPRMTEEADVVFYLLGDLYEKQDDYPNAIKAFSSAIIAKRYDEAPIYYRRGNLLLRAGEYEPAIRDFSWAISELVGVPIDVFVERGIAILMLGHDELAQKDFDKFLAIYPDGKEMLSKRIEAAKKQRDELKKQNPESRATTK